MYQDRNYSKDEYNDEFVYEYVTKMRLEDISKYIPTRRNVNDYPLLEDIIKCDKNLEYIYDDNSFILKVDIHILHLLNLFSYI